MLRRMLLALMLIVLGLVPAIARAADQSVTDKMKDTATTAKDKMKETVNEAAEAAKEAATGATEKTKETTKRAGQELSDSWITLKTTLSLSR